MGKIFEKAKDYPVASGDTLSSIASANNVTWQDIAQFNWATDQPREVLRALCERVGALNARAIEQNVEPAGLMLEPKFGPKPPQPIRIPKVWIAPDPLEIRKKYVLKIKQHTPASAVGIRAIDKWFMPDDESCDIGYVLDGVAETADAVDFEVYASNYAKLDDWNNGIPKFTPLAGVPVYTEELKEGNIAARSSPSLSTWKGEANCKEGALSGVKRTINVAFSPYTALLRYRKKGGDGEKARIDLDPFWPVFESGTITAKSGEITWKIQDATNLKVGLLQILRGDGEVVFMKGLSEGEIAGGKYAWDGSYSNGGSAAREQMPYRVLIEVHRDIDEPNGLALAAAHTEVRLFVDPRTLPFAQANYDYSVDFASLDLSLADLYHKADPVRGDGKVWTKFKLAQAGFHPGPVTDASDTNELKAAIREFKRSVPLGAAGHYTRMAISDVDDEAMKGALETLQPNRARPWFGKPALAVPATHDQCDWKPATEAGAIKTALRDKGQQMIVWIDDRNWYSDGIYWQNPNWNGTIAGISAATRTFLNNDPANMAGAERGSLEDRDDRTAADARDIARPWIPIQADFRILRKGQSLTDNSDTVSEEKNEKSRKVIGPIRVDWSFDEIEETELVSGMDLPKLDPVVENTLNTLYGHVGTRNRTRIALRWLLDNLKGEHPRADISKRCKYYNTPAAYGGIRPNALATYFSKPFGTEASSLYPYTAKESTRETVMCAVHDDVGQAREQFFPKRQGRAGVYFHPSLIAGDGYQLRGQVFFEKDGDYQFPNADVLKARYAKLPQAHSAKFRLWRKTSLRGYVCWGADNSWTAPVYNPHGTFPDSGPRGFRNYYTACHVHIVNELAEPDNNLAFTPTGLFPQLASYQQMVIASLNPTDLGPRRNLANITLSDNYVWPWGGLRSLGLGRSTRNADPFQFNGTLSERFVFPLFLNFATRISLEIVKAIEAQRGWMRGHVIVQYQTSPRCFLVNYQCPTCGSTYAYLQTTDTAIPGQRCNFNGCLDILRLDPEFAFAVGHYQCGTCGYAWFREDHAFDPNGNFHNSECPHCGVGNLTAVAANIDIYLCTAGHLFHAPPGQHGNPCPWGDGNLQSNVHDCTSNHRVAIPIGQDETGQQCGVCNAGTLTKVAPPVRHLESFNGYPMDGYCGNVPSLGLAVTSAGFPAGVSWDVNGDTDLWAHELAHNRYFEHASSSASRPPGDQNLTHDSIDNLVEWPNAPQHLIGAGPLAGQRNFNRSWDRACLMSYITDVKLANPDPNILNEAFDRDRDRPCFCYKCVLKNRGWLLGQAAYQPGTALAAPAIPLAIPTPPDTLRDP